MDKKFIDSVNRKIGAIKKDDPNFYRIDLEERISQYNLSIEIEDVTDYQLGFICLYEENTKLEKLLEKQMDLLKNQKYFRQDIDDEVGTSLREMRLPQDKTSKWQLLFETIIWSTNESGPIIHLYFDGWQLANCKIYYWDEAIFNDISEEDELATAKNKIAAYGLQIDEEIVDEAILKIKNILDSHFPNDDSNLLGHKFKFDNKSDE